MKEPHSITLAIAVAASSYVFLVYLVLALSNEWFSLRVHPEMKVVRK